jgi:hypothetical protein
LYDETGGKGGNKTRNIVIITLSSIAVVAALLGFWYYSYFGRRKRQEGRLHVTNYGETSQLILFDMLNLIN